MDREIHHTAFSGVTEFHAFITSEVAKLDAFHREHWITLDEESKESLDSDWFGSPAPKSLPELATHDTFSGMAAVEKVKKKLQHRMEALLKRMDREVLPKPRLAFNDRALGVFSFDRAAMGMYRLADITTTNPLKTTVSQLHIELGRDGLFTKTRNCYASFEHRRSEQPTLRLYVMAGGNAYQTGEELLYVGIAAGLLVNFLEERNFAVEVHSILGSAFNKGIMAGIITIKKFEERFDLNQLLLLTSDAKYFRYRGFQGLIALSHHFGLRIPANLGRMEPDIGKLIIEELSTKQTPGFKKPLVFEQSYSLEGAVKEVERIITEVA